MNDMYPNQKPVPEIIGLELSTDAFTDDFNRFARMAMRSLFE